jgi:hypothetical protein
MSQLLPQSQLGKIKTKTFVDGFARISVIDEKASDILNLNPVDTVWGRSGGRPIYDRLPGVSQAYRKEYEGEINTGFVYIEPQYGNYSGPGSLETGALQDDPRVLIVYNGTITWTNGQIPTSTLAINLETVVDGGIQDGNYQVGYYLDKNVPASVGNFPYAISSFFLSGSSTIYATNRAAKDHRLDYAISEESNEYWMPSEYGEAGTYEDGSWISFDFTETVTASIFEFKAPTIALATARCALYRSNDAISWQLADSVTPRNGVWTLNNSEGKARYYRALFWSGKVAISEVRYSGEALFPNRRPTGPISSAEIFLEGEFDQIDRPHILLSIITVSDYRVTGIRDVRAFTTVKYEPVASWLTDFQDGVLRKLITDISSYADLYLAPTTGATNFYDSLLEAGVTLESDTSAPTIEFPTEIELNHLTFVNGQEVSTSIVSPVGIYLLGEPTDPSDLTSKAYSDLSLIPTLDDGKY